MDLILIHSRNHLLKLILGNLLTPFAFVQNGLVNGVKECLVLAANNETTSFSDVLSFSGKYKGFQIKSINPESCFKAKAIPRDVGQTWFEIDFNAEMGEVSKTCGDSSKPGCEEGNTW